MTKENAIDLRRIFDGAAKHLHAVQALKRLTMHWDDLLVLILISKLDSLTLRERETFLTGNELPSLKQLFYYSSMSGARGYHKGSAKKVEAKSQPNVKWSSCAATIKPKHHFCQGDHIIYYCKNFVALPVSQRAAEIRSRKLCVNCLRSSSHTCK